MIKQLISIFVILIIITITIIMFSKSEKNLSLENQSINFVVMGENGSVDSNDSFNTLKLNDAIDVNIGELNNKLTNSSSKFLDKKVANERYLTVVDSNAFFAEDSDNNISRKALLDKLYINKNIDLDDLYVKSNMKGPETEKEIKFYGNPVYKGGYAMMFKDGLDVPHVGQDRGMKTIDGRLAFHTAKTVMAKKNTGDHQIITSIFPAIGKDFDFKGWYVRYGNQPAPTTAQYLANGGYQGWVFQKRGYSMNKNKSGESGDMGSGGRTYCMSQEPYTKCNTGSNVADGHGT